MKPTPASNPNTAVIEEGRVLDYITGREIRDSPKEQVRQHIARALFHEYGISVDDMAAGYKIPARAGPRLRTSPFLIPAQSTPSPTYAASSSANRSPSPRAKRAP